MKAWVKAKLRGALESLREDENSKEGALPPLTPPKRSLPPDNTGDAPLGASPPHHPSTAGGVKSLVIFNDVHIPFHHKQGCQNVLQFCEDMQPDHVVINGDFLDCYSVSIFPKEPGMPNLQSEIDEGAAFLKDLRRRCPDAEMDYLEGNHEERLKRLVKQQHSLYGLRALTIPSLLGLDKLNIRYHAYKHPVNFGARGILTVVHGHKVSKHSAYSAKAHLLDDGYQNVIIGHTHRMGFYYHDGHMGRRRAYENGGLFDKQKLDYVVGPNWQMGFCVVYLREDDPDFLQVHPIEMTDSGSFVWNGKVYGK